MCNKSLRISRLLVSLTSIGRRPSCQVYNDFEGRDKARVIPVASFWQPNEYFLRKSAHNSAKNNCRNRQILRSSQKEFYVIVIVWAIIIRRKLRESKPDL